jgi:alkanesulfonate monooxygenase SsuD/methylene tetrahydromethanopterin reductase-like flavin-dependent oxidoreductase (luciferase family)
MSNPHRSLVFATEHLSPVLDVPPRAETAGFHRIWTTEFQGRDALVRATALGQRSTTLGVGTGIAYGFAHAPLALAAAALDAQELTGGRFVLGLGAGTRGLRRAYGVEDWTAPATRLSELFAFLRETWSRPEWKREVPPPLLAAAGVNETMLAVAARHADRVLLHPLCLVDDHLTQRVLPALELGQSRRAHGRSALSAWCITAIDHDPQLARDRARRQLAFYLSTPGYRGVVEGTPWESVASNIREGFMGGSPNWASLALEIPDELLDQVAVTGDPQTAARAADLMADRLAGFGADEIVFQAVDAGDTGLAVADGLQLIIDTLRPRY